MYMGCTCPTTTTRKRPHNFLVCNLHYTDKIVPNRLAFGMVSHANEKQTAYCLRIVMRHCREIFEIHKFHNLDI